MSDWKASTGRITLFLPVQPSPHLPSAVDLYRAVWGTEPDSSQRQANPLTPSLAQGSHESLIVACVTHQFRIDFNVTPASSPTQEINQASFPLFEDVTPVYEELATVIDAVGETSLIGSTARVALVIQFLAIKENTSEANKALLA